jgi:enterobactin synthetase component D
MMSQGTIAAPKNKKEISWAALRKRRNNKISESTFIHDVRVMSLPGLTSASALGCRFVQAHYNDDLFLRHGLPLPPGLANAAPKRKAEHFAGRYLCKELLVAQGLPFTVPVGHSRAPVWPAGWTGSITHIAGMAISCLSRQADVALLGIDVENWINPGIADDIAHAVIDQDERQLLANSWPFSESLSLVFSAKESFFKAAFPLVGRYFDFNCVRMVDIDYTAQRFSLQVVKPLAPALPLGRIVRGSFLRDVETIFTVVA